MPEGHVIHRLAGELALAFSGRIVGVTSPQGRFASAASLLDGTVLRTAQAYGKHLLIDFGPPPEAPDGVSVGPYLHIHLGLIGKLRWVRPGPVTGADTLRLRIETGEHAAELRGPQTCALIGPGESPHCSTASALTRCARTPTLTARGDGCPRAGRSAPS